jgi:hypothetical protein
MNRQGYPSTWSAGRSETVLASFGKLCPSVPPDLARDPKGVRPMAERLKKMEHVRVLPELRLQLAEER